MHNCTIHFNLWILWIFCILHFNITGKHFAFQYFSLLYIAFKYLKNLFHFILLLQRCNFAFPIMQKHKLHFNVAEVHYCELKWQKCMLHFNIAEVHVAFQCSKSACCISMLQKCILHFNIACSISIMQ